MGRNRRDLVTESTLCHWAQAIVYLIEIESARRTD